jgi:hypothetical protein
MGDTWRGDASDFDDHAPVRAARGLADVLRGLRGKDRRRRRLALHPRISSELAALSPDLPSGDQRFLVRHVTRLPHPDELPLATGLTAIGGRALWSVGWRVLIIGTVLTIVLIGATPLAVRVIVAAGGVLCWLLLHRLGRGWISTGGALRDFRSSLDQVRRNRVFNRCAGRFVVREQLDPGAQQLLDRAFVAMRKVRNSQLAEDGMIDRAAAAVVFAEQRWNLARDVADQARVRRELQRVGQSPQGKRTSAKADEKRAEVEESEAASAAQVEALERYAESVREADDIYRDEKEAHRLDESIGDLCTELRARTAGQEVREADLENLISYVSDIVDALGEERRDPGDPERVERRKRAEEATAKAEAKRAHITLLRAQFLELRHQSDQRERGRAFGALLSSLFTLSELWYHGSYRIETDQVQGAMSLDSVTYLLAARWSRAPVVDRDIGGFAHRVEQAVEATRGLFISMAGYSDEVLGRYRDAGENRLILMDGRDIALILEGRVELLVGLRAKVRAAVTRGEPYLPLATLL